MKERVPVGFVDLASVEHSGKGRYLAELASSWNVPWCGVSGRVKQNEISFWTLEQKIFFMLSLMGYKRVATSHKQPAWSLFKRHQLEQKGADPLKLVFQEIDSVLVVNLSSAEAKNWTEKTWI